MPDSDSIYRLYVTDGVPASGAHDPNKLQIMDWGLTLENARDRVSANKCLLVNGSVSAAATYVMDAALITQAFSRLEVVLNGVYHDSGSDQTLNVELSGDGGSTWATANAMSKAVSASIRMSGRITIDNARPTTGSRMICADLGDEATDAPVSIKSSARTVNTGYINAIRLSWSAGSFAASGTVTLVGLD